MYSLKLFIAQKPSFVPFWFLLVAVNCVPFRIFYVNCGPGIFYTYVNCSPGIFYIYVNCGPGIFLYICLSNYFLLICKLRLSLFSTKPIFSFPFFRLRTITITDLKLSIQIVLSSNFKKYLHVLTVQHQRWISLFRNLWKRNLKPSTIFNILFLSLFITSIFIRLKKNTVNCRATTDI